MYHAAHKWDAAQKPLSSRARVETIIFRFLQIETRMSLRWQLILLWALTLAPVLGQESPVAQAEALLKEGKAGTALPILLELHRATPSDANLCQQIGIAYTQLQDLSQAEKFYREAVRLSPQFLAARKNLGTVLWFLNR